MALIQDCKGQSRHEESCRSAKTYLRQRLDALPNSA